MVVLFPKNNKKIFGNGSKIHEFRGHVAQVSENVVNYDITELLFHGMPMEYDDSGRPIGQQKIVQECYKV